MLRRTGLILVLLAWACAQGLQWPVLQLAAWAKMAADYRETLGWREAVAEAVTGPKCRFCHAIDEASAESRTTESQAPGAEEIRLVFAAPTRPFELRVPARHPTSVSEPRRLIHARRDPPPHPPPRQNSAV